MANSFNMISIKCHIFICKNYHTYKTHQLRIYRNHFNIGGVLYDIVLAIWEF